jgi:hypothetical protein
MKLSDSMLTRSFHCIEELSPGMRPACRVHDARSADMIVGSVAITLQDPLEVTREQFGTFSFPAHAKNQTPLHAVRPSHLLTDPKGKNARVQGQITV